MLRWLPGQRKMRATEEQVEQAAKFIIDRFGIPTVVEEEEEEVGGVHGTEWGCRRRRRRSPSGLLRFGCLCVCVYACTCACARVCLCEYGCWVVCVCTWRRA